MWDQKRREGLREPCDMLRDIHERHRQIPRSVQNGKAEGAHQHHVARSAEAVLPKHNRPGQERDGQDHRDRGMEQPQLFQVN